MNELKSIENMNFEEALMELESIVNKIDSGTQDLETSINNFERGNLLRKHCEKKLKEAQLKIETITKNENGEIKFEEFKI